MDGFVWMDWLGGFEGLVWKGGCEGGDGRAGKRGCGREERCTGYHEVLRTMMENQWKEVKGWNTKVGLEKTGQVRL